MKKISYGVFVFISMAVLMNSVTVKAQDLDSILKGALMDYLDEKAEEAGIDISGKRKPKNVNLTFIGANAVSSDTFNALYVEEVPTTTTPVPTSNQTVAEQDCFNRVQGKIAWNNSGSKRWSPQNILKLCDGAVVPSAPPMCFYTAMFRGASWGQRSQHKMTWMLASQLCNKAKNANTPIACLKRRLMSNYSLENAINACDVNPRTLAVAPRANPRPRPVPVNRLQESECYKYIQGQIAWDAAKKNKKWNKTNIQRLCKGTTAKFSPGNCFSYAMHKGDKWGKRPGDVMNWSKAINLCEGTSNAKRTTTCFKNSIKAGRSVDKAVARCDR